MECVVCGARNREGARFCDECGEALDVRGTDDPGAVASRRVVTVVFADLTGSTSIGERTDPEAFRALIRPFFGAMRAEVEARGGRIVKFQGDGVMAAFGIPEVREDDALRALDAAIGMRAALERLAVDITLEDGAVLSLKVGINTGEVVFSERDVDIVGDPVNVAARLEGAATPGEILVGEETWRATRSNATFEPIAPLVLKGKAEPVPAYRLVSVDRMADASPSRFVGRDRDLETLLRVFDRAVASRAAQLVTIVGAPGLGKTRLAREIGPALGDRALVVETRCDAAGSATLAPIAEVIRRAAGLDDAADEATIEAAIAALVPADDPERDRIVRRAAAVLGAGEPGSTQETFWAVRRLVEGAARARPLVVVLDDIHWAEPLLLDLVEHLAEWNRAPCLLVATGRPELREVRPSLVEGPRPAAVINLEGLDAAATEQLACNLLGSRDVPQDVLAKLPASTEGNPLFVRELVRMLVDDGVLRPANGSWIATIDVDAIDVPPTIQSLLSARVDRLRQQERTVLELASVVGKEFYRGAVAMLAPEGLRFGLDAHLESLRRKELVEPIGTTWIDEPVFRFHHALIRDAAYRRLLKRSRAELHERVADWFEGRTAGLISEHDELVGYHLEQAYESCRQLGHPDDHARALAKRAGGLLASAANAALDRDDLPAAAALAGRSLSLLDADDSGRAEVLIARCESLLAMGDVMGAEPVLAELQRVAASSPRLEAWAACFSGELANLTETSRVHETLEDVSRAADRLATLGDHAGAAKAHTVHAGALARLGRVAASEQALDRALTAARQAGDRRRVTAVLDATPLAALWGPSPVSRAGGRCLDVIRLIRITTGSPAVEATSGRCQAVLEALRGRLDAARRMLRESHRSVEELGLRVGLLETELFAGIVEMVARDPAAAVPHLRDAFVGFRAMGLAVDASRAAALLSRAHLFGREVDEARLYADESERLAGDDLPSMISSRCARAALLARTGDLDEARAVAQEAVDIASRTDRSLDHADACRVLASVCAASGDVQGAERASEQTRALCEAKGATALLMGAERASAITDDRSPTGGVLVHVRANRCMQVVAESLSGLERRDYDAVAAGYAEDAILDDRRPLFQAVYAGREQIVDLSRAMADIGTTATSTTWIATRGDELALARATFKGPDVGDAAFGGEILMLYEIGRDGLLTRVLCFDANELDTAMQELDDRFADLQRLGPDAGNRCADVFAAVLRAFEARDWDALADRYAADFYVVDTRPGLTNDALGREGSLEGWRAVADVGGTRARDRVLASRAERLALTLVTFASDDDSPDAFSTDVIFLNELDDDGLIVRAFLLDADDRVGAFARLEERYGESSAPD